MEDLFRFVISLYNYCRCNDSNILQSTIYKLSTVADEDVKLEYKNGMFHVKDTYGSSDLFGFNPSNPMFSSKKYSLYMYFPSLNKRNWKTDFRDKWIGKFNERICYKLAKHNFGFEFEIRKWLEYPLSNIELAAGIAKECKRIKNSIKLQHTKHRYEINNHCYIYYTNKSNEVDLFIYDDADWMRIINRIKTVSTLLCTEDATFLHFKLIFKSVSDVMKYFGHFIN